MNNVSYVHCPVINCDEPLNGSWKDYECGKNELGLIQYKCPNCNYVFTINDVKINAVLVPDIEGDVFIFDTRNKEVVFSVMKEQKFSDGKDTYVHIPQAILIQPDLVCYHFDSTELSDKEIKNICLKQFIKNKG